MKNMNKKDDILRAAVIEFAAHGYENASIDQIAESANVAKGTVFYHFASKQLLFSTILDEGAARFENEVKSAVAGIDDPAVQISKIIDVETEYIIGYRDFFRVFVGELLKKSSRFESIRTVIEHGKRSGVFRHDVDSDVAAASIFWITAISVLNEKYLGLKDLLLRGILA